MNVQSMKYANQIEACFESVFRDLGTSDEDWTVKYSYILDIFDIRDIERWVNVLLQEGMTEDQAFHHVEKLIHNRNAEYSKIFDKRS